METQVQTMRNENSGITPKLRTYGAIRGVTLNRETHANGGVTLDLSSPTMDVDKHTTGYYVAGLHKAVTFPLKGSDTRNYQYALGVAYAATNGSGLMGTWVEDGIVHAEASEWFACLGRALKAGREREQISIWDVQAGREIRL